METKSIGSFIAALRKANGMTQKDLAEKLAVSDKTVSRWERGDGLPDLTLVPVIAEIFDVSCDELLCGERKKVADEVVDNEQSKSRRQKQLRRVLDGGLQKFKNQSYISRAILLVGVLAAMVANFGFYEALIGYFVTVAIMVVAVVVQVISSNNAYYAVSGDEFGNEDLQKYKVQIYELNRSFAFCLVVALSVISPLVMAVSGAGMSEELFVASAFVLLVVWFGYFLFGQTFLARHAVANGVYTEGKVASVFKLQKLKNKTVALALVLMLVVFACQACLFYGFNVWNNAEILTFTDKEAFGAYLEDGAKYEPLAEDFTADSGMTVYYDEYEYMTTPIILGYIDKKQDVKASKVYWNDGEFAAVEICTRDSWYAEEYKLNDYGNILNYGYFLAMIFAAVYYVANRRKYLA